MTIFFMEGFHHYNDYDDLSLIWGTYSSNFHSLDTSGTKTRDGSNAMGAKDTNYSIIYPIPDEFTQVDRYADPLYAGFDVYFDYSLFDPSGGNGFFSFSSKLTSSDGTRENSDLSLSFNSAGSIMLYSNATLLASSAIGTLTAYNAHRVEILGLRADNPNGVVKVWVDGVLVIDFVGDTLSSFDVPIQGMKFSSPSGSLYNYFSHIIIGDDKTDGLGGSLTYPLGPCLVKNLPSTNVDLDDTPVDEATYVELTNNDTHTYDIEDTVGTENVLLAKAYVSGSPVGLSDRDIQIKVSNGTDIVASKQVFPSGVTVIKSMMFDPNGQAGMDATTVGVRYIDQLINPFSMDYAAEDYVSSTSLTLDMPADVVDDDLLVVVFFARSTPTLPAGWSIVAQQLVNAGSTQELYVATKHALSEGSTLQITQAVSNRMGGQVLRLRASEKALETPIVVQGGVDSGGTGTFDASSGINPLALHAVSSSFVRDFVMPDGTYEVSTDSGSERLAVSWSIVEDTGTIPEWTNATSDSGFLFLVFSQ